MKVDLASGKLTSYGQFMSEVVIVGTKATWNHKSFPHVEFHVGEDPSLFRVSIAVPLVDELIQGLETWFGDRCLLDAFQIFNPPVIPWLAWPL